MDDHWTVDFNHVLVYTLIDLAPPPCAYFTFRIVDAENLPDLILQHALAEPCTISWVRE